MPVTMHATTVPESPVATECIFEVLKKMVEIQGLEEIKQMIHVIENNGECILQKITLGSIQFVVQFYSLESLNKFRERCLNGELAKKLTDILVTDSVRRDAGCNPRIHLTLEESDYQHAYRLLQDVGKIKNIGFQV